MNSYLEKKSGALLKGYQRRYFRLANYELQYFKTKSDRDPKGTIDLRTCKRVSRHESEENGFSIEASKKTYEFRAESKDIQTMWINCLAVFANCNGSVPMPEVFYIGLSECLKFLLEKGTSVEGLFRVSGSSDLCDDVCKRFIYGNYKLPPNANAHVVGSVVKTLLREMPETVFTEDLFENFVNVADVTELRTLVANLPKENREVFLLLAQVCQELCHNEEETKMDEDNLCVCLGPTLGKKEGLMFVNWSKLFSLAINNVQALDLKNFEERKVPEKQGPPDELLQIALDMQADSIHFARRRSSALVASPNNSSQSNTLQGASIVDWILEHVTDVKTRKKATSLGERLVNADLIEGIRLNERFTDSSHLFQFVDR